MSPSMPTAVRDESCVAGTILEVHQPMTHERMMCRSAVRYAAASRHSYGRGYKPPPPRGDGK